MWYLVITSCDIFMKCKFIFTSQKIIIIMDRNYQKYYTDGVSKYCYKKFVIEFKICCTYKSYWPGWRSSTLRRWIIRANILPP